MRHPNRPPSLDWDFDFGGAVDEPCPSGVRDLVLVGQFVIVPYAPMDGGKETHYAHLVFAEELMPIIEGEGVYHGPARCWDYDGLLALVGRVEVGAFEDAASVYWRQRHAPYYAGKV